MRDKWLIAQVLGIPVSILVAGSIWLFSDYFALGICISHGENAGCRSGSLFWWLTVDGNWPFAYGNWSAYWPPVVMAIVAYAIWFGVVFLVRARYGLMKSA
jgi:hypothetical protein